MKKIVISCLFILSCCVSAQARETIQKTLSLGEYAIDGFGSMNIGQFVAYDGECATILRYFREGTVRVCKGPATHVYLSESYIVRMQYDGNFTVYVSYIKQK